RVALVVGDSQAFGDGRIVLARLIVLLGNVALGLRHARLLLCRLERVLVPPCTQPLPKPCHRQYATAPTAAGLTSPRRAMCVAAKANCREIAITNVPRAR